MDEHPDYYNWTVSESRYQCFTLLSTLLIQLLALEVDQKELASVEHPLVDHVTAEQPFLGTLVANGLKYYCQNTSSKPSEPSIITTAEKLQQGNTCPWSFDNKISPRKRYPPLLPSSSTVHGQSIVENNKPSSRQQPAVDPQTFATQAAATIPWLQVHDLPSGEEAKGATSSRPPTGSKPQPTSVADTPPVTASKQAPVSWTVDLSEGNISTESNTSQLVPPRKRFAQPDNNTPNNNSHHTTHSNVNTPQTTEVKATPEAVQKIPSEAKSDAKSEVKGEAKNEVRNLTGKEKKGSSNNHVNEEIQIFTPHAKPSAAGQPSPAAETKQQHQQHPSPSLSRHSVTESRCAKCIALSEGKADPSFVPNPNPYDEANILPTRFHKTLLYKTDCPLRCISYLTTTTSQSVGNKANTILDEANDGVFVAIGSNAKTINIMYFPTSLLAGNTNNKGGMTRSGSNSNLNQSTSSVSLLDGNTPEAAHTVKVLENVHKGSVYSMDYHAESGILISGSNDKYLRISR
jgi:hypothetical protein